MKKDKLKNIIQKNIKQKPSKGFTQNIMQQVTEESFLKLQLKEGLLQQAPANFTANVLEKLNPKSVALYYQPVISKKVWGLISVVFALVIFFSFRDSKTGVTSKYIDITTGIFSSKLNLISQLFTSNNFLVMLIISVLSLMIFDFLLNNGKSIFKRV